MMMFMEPVSPCSWPVPESGTTLRSLAQERCALDVMVNYSKFAKNKGFAEWRERKSGGKPPHSRVPSEEGYLA
jgi:hypothetical protein